MDRTIPVFSSRADLNAFDLSRRMSPVNGNMHIMSAAVDGAIDHFAEQAGTVIDFASNAEIYAVDEPADHIYKVVSGAVRTCKFLDDGRRYIDSFYLPNDVFGFENGPTHEFSCEAVCPSKIAALNRKTSNANAPATSGFDLLSLSAEEMHRAQLQGSMLVKTASERVAEFLLQLSAHSAEPSTLQLPMSRQDIADHLGLTIETVSRIFTQLEASQIILRTLHRNILIRNRRALERMRT